MKPKREGARVMMRLAPTVEGHKRFMATTDRFGLKQLSVSSRLLTWASQQDEVTQAMVLGVYPGADSSSAAERAMKKIAGGS
jgi:hypothetical protein